MNKILVDCKENEELELSNHVIHTCGSVFELEESNVFTLKTVNHFSEPVTKYYTICPNCGYLILLKEEKLPKEMIEVALQKSDDDPLLFRKNLLKSELIYLEKITPKVKARTFF